MAQKVDRSGDEEAVDGLGDLHKGGNLPQLNQGQLMCLGCLDEIGGNGLQGSAGLDAEGRNTAGSEVADILPPLFRGRSREFHTASQQQFPAAEQRSDIHNFTRMNPPHLASRHKCGASTDNGTSPSERLVAEHLFELNIH
nr:hypothetical protein [Arthrobacter crystallopoietes]